MNLIIKNGTLVTPEGRVKADLGIKGEKIVAIGANLKHGDAEVIDAKGMYVMPGAIDVHVHLQLPFCGTVSADDFVNGTKAAACGGVTTVIDFAIQKKGGSLIQAVQDRQAEAAGKVCVDYALHAVPTDWNDRTAGEMVDLVEEGHTTFKMFMIYAKSGMMSDDGALLAALELSARTGAMIGVHAESNSALDLLIDRFHTPELMKKFGAYAHTLSRPNFTEWEAVQRAITWADVTGGKLYIVHSSTGETADLIAEARADGIRAYAETCPQYLLLDDSVFLRDDGHLYGTCPQIKSKEDSERLWEGLDYGDISTVATDTCTFTTTQKAMWEGDFTKIPFGLPGVETMLPLMYSYGVGKKRITLEKMVQVCSTNPAKLMGMYPEKGSLAINSDADIVIFDPKVKKVLTYTDLQTNCDFSPFEGFKLTGYPHITIARGKVVGKEGKFVGTVGHGKWLKRHIGEDI